MKKLNICFDCRVLFKGCDSNISRTGIYFVAKNIVQTLSKRDINLFLYFDDNRLASKIIENLSLNVKEERILNSSSDFLVIDFFLSPVYAIPDQVKAVSHISLYTILYDITPLVFPSYFIQNYQDWFDKVLDGISPDKYYFFISNYTKNDFLKYFPKLNPDNIDVIPLSTNLEYKPNKDIETLRKIKEKYNIPLDKKYLFSLCSLEPRKNIIRVVKTFIDFIQKNKIDDFIFVLGGSIWNGFIEKSESEFPDYDKHQDKIISTGYIDDEALEILYSNAEWFVYTSQYEGFGMPPLEAMKCGCPVITSNNSSLPEVVGDAAIKIDYDSDEQHINAYEKYYFDEKYRSEMAHKGIERAKLFSWDKCVDVILDRMYKVEEKKANKPLVTIITPTYNIIKGGRKDWFIQNLESVQNQTYKNIEQIVIDGASTDGTVELLKEYSDKGWIKFFSEPDKGIYDALNKGTLKANGKYVVCLNSDDCYCNNKAVELEVMKLEANDADACYANSYIIDGKNGDTMQIWNGEKTFFPLFGKFPNHQTFMVKKETLIEDGGFRLDISECADNIFSLDMLLKEKKFVYINEMIVNFRNNGWSSTIQDKVSGVYTKYLFENYGQYHGLTRLDCENLFNNKFLQLPEDKAIDLGCKIDNQHWQKEYFRVLVNHIALNMPVDNDVPLDNNKIFKNRYFCIVYRVLKSLEKNGFAKTSSICWHKLIKRIVRRR